MEGTVKSKSGMKIRRPHLRLTYALIPAEELQEAHDLLWIIKHSEPGRAKQAKDVFFGLTEALMLRYSPLFDEGLEWDNRRELLT